MKLEEVPTTMTISERMREAYAELNIETPFSIWAQAKLWDAITVEQRRATNRNIGDYNETKN